jgi:hypothetical protein
MGNRFVVLSFLTGLFQLVCLIAIIIGMTALFSDQSNMGRSNPFAELAPGMRIIGGAMLVLYGLTGLVFSGGVNVLISIDENTYVLREKLPAAIAALQRTSVGPAPVSVPPTVETHPASPVVVEHAVANPVPVDLVCSNCGISNDPNGRFCEHCGQPLSPG